MTLFPIAGSTPGTFPDRDTSRISVNSGTNPAHSPPISARIGAFEGRLR